MSRKLLKFLGAYLITVCILQICVYLALSLSPEKYDWLLYFDPRIGIFYLESGFRGAEHVAPTMLRWLSAAWIFMLGLFLFSGRPLIKTYIVSEIVLSLPSLFFVSVVVWANLSPAHGFSIRELFYPALVMVAFNLFPLVAAFWVRSKGATVA